MLPRQCGCGKEATSVVIMFESVDYGRSVGRQIYAVYVQQIEITAKVRLILVCDSCEIHYSNADYLVKARLTEESKKQLIEIVQEKHRLMSL